MESRHSRYPGAPIGGPVRLASTDGTAAGSTYFNNDTDIVLIAKLGKVSSARTICFC